MSGIFVNYVKFFKFKELEKQGFHLERRLLTVDGSIKSLGTYEVKAKLFNDVTATFKLKVAIDAAMDEELKKQQAEAQKRNADKKAKAEALKAAAAAEAEAAANAEEAAAAEEAPAEA